MEYIMLAVCVIIVIILIILVASLKEKKVKPIDLEKIEEQKSTLEEVLQTLELSETTERQLTSYEQEQEDTAIISYQELVKAVEEKKKGLSPEDMKIINDNQNKTQANHTSLDITEQLETYENEDYHTNLDITEQLEIYEKEDYPEEKPLPIISENHNQTIEIQTFEQEDFTPFAYENNSIEITPIEEQEINFQTEIKMQEPEKKRFKNSEFISPIFGKDKKDEEFLKELKDFRSTL